MKLRTATAKDAPTLSEIAAAAKSHWGYPQAWLDGWRDQLTVSREQIERGYALVCELEEAPVGFICVSVEGTSADVEHLWVLPGYMGRGIGRALFERALGWCQTNRIAKLQVVSDPNAQGFYLALGGRLVGGEPSSPAPRSLPVFQFDLGRR